MNDSEYNERELNRVVGSDDDSLRLKVTGSAGETRWLSVKPAQYDLIVQALIDPTFD